MRIRIEQYLERRIDHELIEWKESEPHKPLLLRGARQVGKTSAVRHLAPHFEHYVEINFERQETMAALFDGDLDVRQICTIIARLVDVPIEGGRPPLLFLDEIQSRPRAVMSLRFFREDFPQLHVVAAGSLLEFALAELPTFGVGRIRSLFMYPMTFDEFLTATAGRGLWEHKRTASPGHPLDLPIVVKVGTQGGMKSLWDFMCTKHVQTTVRTSLENFGLIDNDGLTCDVIPLYALSNL